MITYKLKKGGVIECTGFTSEFTLAQLQEQIAGKQKAIKELNANAEVKQSVVDNILEHNSFIKKLAPEMIHACFMYHEAKCEQMSYTKRSTEFSKSLRKDKLELVDILKQIPELDNAK